MHSSRAAANKIGRFSRMRTNNKTMMAVMILGAMLLVLFAAIAGAGCSRQTDSVAAIDTQYLYRGELIVFNGEFVHEYDVVDYVVGDPAAISTYADVVAMYTTQEQGVAEGLYTKVIRANGDIVTLEQPLRLLPREENGLVFNGRSDGEKVSLELDRRTNDYRLTVVRSGQPDLVIEDVSDAWVAYDTVYYLVGDVVYQLSWWDPIAAPEVYCVGAFGVSHHSDEGEGALVPAKLANAEYYYRWDILSPFPTN